MNRHDSHVHQRSRALFAFIAIITTFAVALVTASPRTAEAVGLEIKILAPDGVAGDLFGVSLDVNEAGGVVVGAYGTEPGAVGGAVYVTSPDGLGGYTTPTRLQPSDIQENDLFGRASAIAPDGTIIAASRQGLYLFVPDGAGGYSESRLTSPTGGPLRGYSSAFDFGPDGTLAIATTGTGPGGDYAAAAYVLTPSGGGYTPTPVFSDETVADARGANSIAIAADGTFVMGFAQYESVGRQAGAAFVFTPDGAGGYIETRLVGSDLQTGFGFGGSVAITNDGTIAVGASNASAGGTRNGAVYLFTPDGAGGYGESKIAASDGEFTDRFGHAIDFNASGSLLVGAWADDDGADRAGSAYLYSPDAAGGYIEEKLIPSDPVFKGWFGRAVALADDGTALVGSERGRNVRRTGVVYAYPGDSCPTNDDFGCSTDVASALPQTAIGSSAAATAEPGEPVGCGTATAPNSLWWSWTAAASGPVLVDTLGSDFNTQVAVYTGAAVGSLAVEACNADTTGASGESMTSFAATAGTTYYLQVSGANGIAEGSVALTLSETSECNGLLPTVDMNRLGITSLSTGPDDDVVIGTAGDDDVALLDGNDAACLGAGDDRVNGGSGNDMIQTGEGDDEIVGGPGNDHIDAGAGNDQVTASSGADLVEGGEGDDDISTSSGDDEVNGGPGHDRIAGGPGDDVLRGDAGNDYIRGSSGNDRIHGGNDNDELRGDDGNDLVDGQDGDDKVYGNRGDDELLGDTGADRMFGQDGNDSIDGGEGDDRIEGGPGQDTVTGQDGDDTIFGDGDNDWLSGGAGDDLISGKDGNDTIFGRAGNDRLYGSDGDDEVSGGRDDDDIRGNSGDDILDGNSGDDQLNGGSGSDECNGHSGVDIATRCETEFSIP